MALKPIAVLVSACGAPGTAALIRALCENGEREVRIVGTDMGELAIGRHLADAFHRVPGGSDPGFADAMLEVCRSEGVDAVLPQSSFDLLGLAEAKDRFEGIAVLVSSSGGDPPLERQGRDIRACSTGSASAARPGDGFRAARRSLRPPASSATRPSTSA